MEQKKFNTKNFIWTEKYRPNIDSIVGECREKVKKMLEKQNEMQHLLLYGPPGVGKTSLSLAIIKHLKADKLILNTSDDRKIESVREKIKEFAITKSSKENLRRVVICDEADGMTKQAQEALRNIMETYAGNVLFILTANNLNKIHSAIQSRCLPIPFIYPPREEIYNYLLMICKNEGLDCTEEGLNKLIKLNYPSIRNMIVALQDLSVDGKAVTPETVQPVNQIYDLMWNYLENKKWKEIKEEVLSSNLNARELNRFFWEKALTTENLKIIQICCRNEKDIAWGADEKVVFVTSIIELCK